MKIIKYIAYNPASKHVTLTNPIFILSNVLPSNLQADILISQYSSPCGSFGPAKQSSSLKTDVAKKSRKCVVNSTRTCSTTHHEKMSRHISETGDVFTVPRNGLHVSFLDKLNRDQNLINSKTVFVGISSWMYI